MYRRFIGGIPPKVHFYFRDYLSQFHLHYEFTFDILGLVVTTRSDGGGGGLVDIAGRLSGLVGFAIISFWLDALALAEMVGWP